jgi:YfiR/HmsC-like
MAWERQFPWSPSPQCCSTEVTRRHSWLTCPVSGTMLRAGMCFSRPKSVLVGLARLSLLVTCTMPSRAQTQADEYRVKAGFIFHFAQFVEWPAGTFSSSAGSITFCTLGEDPFHGDMESLLRGKAVAGKSVRVLHLKQVQDSKQCHVLFLDRNDNQLVPSALAIVKNLPILTVGESDVG